MAGSRALSSIIFEKVQEQVRSLEGLASVVPPDGLAWRLPVPKESRPSFQVRDLLGHLLECLAGFCATLYALHAKELAHFAALKDESRTVDTTAQFAERLSRYARHLDEGFSLLTDDSLALRLPTVFVPQGEPVLTLLLGNLEHLINHKHQLFLYLKMMGVPVGTSDLYCLRGE